jgi:hypothetical protein
MNKPIKQLEWNFIESHHHIFSQLKSSIDTVLIEKLRNGLHIFEDYNLWDELWKHLMGDNDE